MTNDRVIKRVLASLFLLVVIVGVSVAILTKPLSDSQLAIRGYKDSESCAEITDLNKRNSCYFYSATHRKDVKTCNNVFDNVGAYAMPGARDRCIDSVASQANNLEYCMIIEHELNKYSCISHIGALRSDPSVCRLIPEDFDFAAHEIIDLKDHCFKQVAERTKNPSLCSEIRGKDSKWLCEDNLKE